MAVDANILIFERMKEELRWGRPLKPPSNWAFTGPGLQSAIPMPALLLPPVCCFGSAPVQFAVLLSLWPSAFSFPFLRLLLLPALYSALSMHVNFMKYKWIYFGISFLVLIPGAFSLIRYGLRLSIDFTGGTLLRNINVQYPISNIQDIAKKQDVELSSVQASQDDTYLCVLRN